MISVNSASVIKTNNNNYNSKEGDGMNVFEKIIIKSLFASLFKDNKITSKEYKKLLDELNTVIA